MTVPPEYYDFVYVTSYNECDEPLVAGLAAAFAAKGKRFAVIGYTSTYVQKLHEALGVPFFNLRNTGALKKIPKSDYRKLEERIGDTLTAFTFPERRYYMTPINKTASRTAAILDGLDNLLHHIDIGCMIHKLGAELIRRVTMLESERRGIRTVLLGTFPAQFLGRTYLHSQFWSERDSDQIPLSNINDEVNFNQFREALEGIRARKQVVHYSLVGMRKWSESVKIANSMIKNHETEFLKDIISRRKETLNFRLRDLISNILSKNSIPENDFYFFPLHVFDDSQITVRNPQFYDQSWIIELISRYLPTGMKLVVKMHPGLDGAVSIQFLKSMRRLKNVVLLRGDVNAHNVIQKSAGVIVINSTVALEALLHDKPVLVLGNWTFGNLGMTEQLNDYRELSQQLHTLRRQKVDRQLVESRLYDLYGEMYRLSYNRDPINFDDIAGGIIEFSRTDR